MTSIRRDASWQAPPIPWYEPKRKPSIRMCWLLVGTATLLVWWAFGKIAMLVLGGW